jgi:hypothetical protein
MNFLKSFISALFVFVFLWSASFATTANSSGSAPASGADLVFEVEKSVSSLTVPLDSPFTVTITVKNLGSSESSFLIRESASNFEMVDPLPKEYSTPSDDILAVRPPSYDWTISIPANSEKSVTYRAKAKTVGSFTIGPTEVFSSSKKVLSNALILTVACSLSSSCDESLGENRFTCPQKCGAQNISENDSIPQAPDLALIPSPTANDSIPTSTRLSENTPIPTERILPFVLGAIVLVVLALAIYFFVIKKK